MRLGELFAGYGGLGMAVEEVFGAELAWVSEWETAPSKILAHHWPHVPNYGDVTKIDWANIEPVDIISGGSPCQDLSLAGKRRGMAEGTRSNLWESMREGIATIRPRYVVWENVRGSLSAEATSVSEMEQSEGRLGADGDPNLRAIGRVLGDLADLGYDAEWRGLTASNVGATHGRFRVFLLAALPDTGSLGLEAGRLSRRPAQEVAESANDQQVLQDANITTRGRDRAPATYPHDGLHEQGRRDMAEAAPGGERKNTRTDWGSPHRDRGDTPTDWGTYGAAVRRWERVNGPAPRPTEPTGRDGAHRLSPAFVEWMMGLPAGWVTQVPGVNRSAQIKALGNGVVPQQAIAALRDMLAAFEQKREAA